MKVTKSIKTMLVLISIFIINNLCSAQDIEPQAKQNISFELGGNGLLYSLNYEYIFSNNIAVKSGISLVNFQESGSKKNQLITTFPITCSYLYDVGKNEHFIEAGLGIMLLLSSGDLTSFNSKTDLFPNITTTLGYRYKKVDSKWNYRIAFTPYYGMKSLTSNKGEAFNIFASDSDLQLWGGIGIGYEL